MLQNSCSENLEVSHEERNWRFWRSSCEEAGGRSCFRYGLTVCLGCPGDTDLEISKLLQSISFFVDHHMYWPTLYIPSIKPL